MRKKILIIDDEENIVELIKFNLELNGLETIVAYDGLEGFVKTKEEMPDLILLDWMLPGISGIEICKKIRSDEKIKSIPIIMLTAKNLENNKVEGLNTGADDYITKPFSIKELMARLNAVLRRYEADSKKKSEKIIEGDLLIDLNNYTVSKNQETLELTLKEFELLSILAQNKGKVLSRNFLLDKIWGYEYFGETRTVDVHIRHLRKKIEDDDKKPKYIETVRGVGYKFK